MSSSAGAFSYYLLVLSYAPDFCDQPGGEKDPRECGVGRRIGFVVHGLWPQGEESRGPEHCGGGRVPAAVIDATLGYVPTASLIQHEWSSHGSCTGLEPGAYFARLREARDHVRIPADLAQPTRPLELSPIEIQSRFAAANPTFPREAFRVSCYPDHELQEVRICLGRDTLDPRPCGRRVGRCDATRVSLRPAR